MESDGVLHPNQRLTQEQFVWLTIFREAMVATSCSCGEAERKANVALTMYKRKFYPELKESKQ